MAMRWYDRDTGEYVEGAGLKEARENGYLPSVTGVIDEIWHSYGLIKWRFDKVFMHAEQQVRDGLRDIDRKYAEQRAKEETDQYLAQHTFWHDQIALAYQMYLDEAPAFNKSKFASVVKKVASECEVDRFEHRMKSKQEGYCGQPDAYGRDIVDWKFTGRTGPVQKLMAHGMQLAGYSCLHRNQFRKWVNVIIPRDNFELARLLHWTPWEQGHLIACWRTTFRLWTLKNNYDPREAYHRNRGHLQVRFKEAWDGLDSEQKRELAKECGSTVNYLSQIANGHRKMSREFMRRLVKNCEDYTATDAVEDVVNGD